MCLYPRLIRNRKYAITKKNGGDVPPVKDERVLMVPVGCGNCIECRKQKSREWQIRMLEDVRHNKNGKFVTLTFSNKSIRDLAKEIKGLKGYDLDNQIATLATRRFLERWRKKYKVSLRHWLVTELGHSGTEHLHMHGIIWTDESLEEVEKHWKYGYIWKGKENYVNEKTVNYLVKYVSKVDKLHEGYKPKVLTSAGIGKGYTDRKDADGNKYNGKETKETYTTRTGHKIALSKYWRNKIYSEEEREKLWLHKLDEQIRYVDKTKIDISKGEEEYYKILKEAQAKNKRLGYGEVQINWDKRAYENERRELKIKQRIARGEEDYIRELKAKIANAQGHA